jgi:two-component system response regulator HydG
LFGVMKGAFTGAVAQRAGLVEAAAGGTLFLDEVGDIPLAQQVKLLRLIETGTYRPVGSAEWRQADVRIIAATHWDVPKLVADGRFRADLYYRLSTFPIHLPPLRERQQDIPLLIDSFLLRLKREPRLSVDLEAMGLLQQQEYPGNVRELRNLVERASLWCDGEQLRRSHVEQAIAMSAAALPSASGIAAQTAETDVASSAGRDALEAAWLRTAMHRHRGSREELARQLGMSPRTLYRKLRRYGLTSDPDA